MCVCVCVYSVVSDFTTPWTSECQAPLSMRFSSQEYWIGLSFPPPRDVPDPGTEATSLVSPALADGFFFYHCATREALILRMVFCKWRKLHRDHFYYWSVSFKTHKNFTEYWLYLEIKITLKNSSDFYLIPCGDLWLTTQCLNAIYSLQELADTTSANRSLFSFNLKDYFFVILLKKWSWKRGFIKVVKEVSKF